MLQQDVFADKVISGGNKLSEFFEWRIDFSGQHLVTQIANVVLVLATVSASLLRLVLLHATYFFGKVISFIIGFVLQSLTATFSVFGASVLILAVMVLPPWPFLNRNPIQWQKATQGSTESKKKR
ncbi:microsomal signal peptidase 12 kDa subunit-domain-containing protein [Flagelloscypha sp. PMI_526]|nr:microsomal signal peptidase 12 kDa subunit-domain-containing protein [Flagelloscypha sp. PMI_526]